MRKITFVIGPKQPTIHIDICYLSDIKFFGCLTTSFCNCSLDSLQCGQKVKKLLCELRVTKGCTAYGFLITSSVLSQTWKVQTLLLEAEKGNRKKHQ
jgi:hypothetical protein